MRTFLANHYRQIANETKVTIRKGLRNAIKAKTPAALEFIKIHKAMDRAARSMQPLKVEWLTGLSTEDTTLLARYLRACNFQVNTYPGRIEVSA